MANCCLQMDIVSCMNALVPSKNVPMPVTKGRLCQYEVKALRDSRCSGIVVKKFSKPEQYTAQVVVIRLPSNTKEPSLPIIISTSHIHGGSQGCVSSRCSVWFTHWKCRGGKSSKWSKPSMAWAQVQKAMKKTNPLIVAGSKGHKVLSIWVY